MQKYKDKNTHKMIKTSLINTFFDSKIKKRIMQEYTNQCSGWWDKIV